MPLTDANDFSLKATLESGQAFRWQLIGEWYYGFINGHIVRVRQVDNQLHYESPDKALTQQQLRYYFALDLPLKEILRSIDVDMQIHQAVTAYPGLRIMRQETWETLASFICSSLNNVKRITRMLDYLSQDMGQEVVFGEFRGFTFPAPETIALSSERSLRALGFGYRASYLLSTARFVAEGKLRLRHLRMIDYPSAKGALLSCDGVGDKVADCVALFGCEKYEAFPVDIWMERAMRYYFRHRRMTRNQVHEYARHHFGAWAGYAQQYLYHYVRQLQGERSPRKMVRAS